MSVFTSSSMTEIQPNTWSGQADRAGCRERAAPSQPKRICVLRGHTDLDLPRFGFLAQRKPDRQDAIPVLGADFRGVHRLRKREGAAEGPVAPLDVVKLLFLHVAGHLLFALDRQGAVLPCR